MNKNNLFSIGEVSKLFHISVSSLRHYENIGLLQPACISKDSKYRYYSTEQFEVLNTIRYLRALDTPLSDIKTFLKNRDVNKIEKILLHQKEEVLKKEYELKRLEKKIDHRLNWLIDAQNTPLDVISIVELPSIRIAWAKNKIKINHFLDMEKPIRDLDESKNEAVVFLGKIGLGITQENLIKRKIQEYDGVFLLLDEEDDYNGKTLILEKTKCVRLRFRGSHTESFSQYLKLLNYIEDNHLKIASFSREITLIDYGITSDSNKFVTEIAIPIKEN